ncbi:ubiquitin-conjugating enzyme, partial [Trifolium medium]|nr:ubiquitin-conjugating enzyme [Trifolium medium]
DDDLVVLGETSRKRRNKGKVVETIHGGYGDHQAVHVMGKLGTVSGIQSSNRQPSVSHNLINVGGQGSNPLFIEDDYLYKFTLLPEYDLGLKKTRNGTLQLNNSKIHGSKMGSSSLQIKTDNVGQFSGTKAAPNK